MSNKIILISGPSGVGKKTIIDTFINHAELNLAYSISMTTRTKRPDEQDGREYYFVSSSEFDNAIQNNELLEWAEFFGNKYGTKKSEIDRIFSNNKSVLLEIETEGAMQVLKNADKDKLISIFILPPSFEELKARLFKRGTESASDQELRLKKAKNEISQKEMYDYIVINDNVNRASNEIIDIILKNTINN